MNAVLLATPVAILALVELAKQAGLPTKLASLLSVVIGVALGMSDFYLHDLPAYQAAAQSLILGLTASGVWDIAKRAAGKGNASTDGDSKTPAAQPAHAEAPEVVA